MRRLAQKHCCLLIQRLQSLTLKDWRRSAPSGHKKRAISSRKQWLPIRDMHLHTRLWPNPGSTWAMNRSIERRLKKHSSW